MTLTCAPNLQDTDGIYERLIAMLEAQPDDALAMRASARLILLLMNHIGDKATIEEAIERARICAETSQ